MIPGVVVVAGKSVARASARCSWRVAGVRVTKLGWKTPSRWLRDSASAAAAASRIRNATPRAIVRSPRRLFVLAITPGDLDIREGRGGQLRTCGTEKINRVVDVSVGGAALRCGPVPEPIAQSPAPDSLPLGVVTFLLPAVGSSPRPGRAQAEAATIMARHAHLIAAAVARHGGVQPVEQGEGDSTVAAFALAREALSR